MKGLGFGVGGFCLRTESVMQTIGDDIWELSPHEISMLDILDFVLRCRACTLEDQNDIDITLSVDHRNHAFQAAYIAGVPKLQTLLKLHPQTPNLKATRPLTLNALNPESLNPLRSMGGFLKKVGHCGHQGHMRIT